MLNYSILVSAILPVSSLLANRYRERGVGVVASTSRQKLIQF